MSGTDISNFMGQGFGQPNGPGFVDPFSLGFLGQASGNAMQAMHNRYSQLGLGVPSGGTPQSAAAGGTSLTSGGPGTAEQMDLGQIPSLSGGIPGMEEAAVGQLQTQALGNTGTAGQGGKGSGIGGLGSLGGLFGK